MTAVAHIQKGMLEAYSFLFFWQFYYPYDTHVYTPTGLGLERDLDPLLRFDSGKPSFRRGEQSDQGPYHSKRLLPIINIRERVYHTITEAE